MIISAPAVLILDENEHIISERHYKVDSSLHLICRASQLTKGNGLGYLNWYKEDRLLDPGSDTRVKIKWVYTLLYFYTIWLDDDKTLLCLYTYWLTIATYSVSIHMILLNPFFTLNQIEKCTKEWKREKDFHKNYFHFLILFLSFLFCWITFT